VGDGVLEKELAAIREALAKTIVERDEYLKLVNLLRQQNECLKRGILGQKAERLPKNEAQLSLAILSLLEAGRLVDAGKALDTAPDAKDLTEKITYVRRKPTGRNVKKLDDLPLVRVRLIPAEVERKGIENFDEIGVEVRHVVERRPGSLVHLQFEQVKYAPKDRTRGTETEILAAEMIETPIHKGAAGPGLLADTIVKRFQDHLPMNRLESIYERECLHLSRSTICGWHEQLLPLLKPVTDAMLADALRHPYLCTDSTGVLVQAPEKCRSGHFWVLIAPNAHVLFRYTSKHDGAAVDSIFKGYRGYLVADATNVYDHLFEDGSILEVGCWAHVRRYFFKALDSDPDRAKTALAMIGALFKIERDLTSAPRKKRHDVRQRMSRKIVEDFFAWCERERPSLLDEMPIQKAVGYALNQREALKRFLAEPMLPIHNNMSELALRRQVVGRKNWLFVGNDDSAEINTTLVSLLASCQMHKIEPWSYLRDLLCLLPDWNAKRVLDLAPANWKATLERPETQQVLAANPLRRFTLPETSVPAAPAPAQPADPHAAERKA
jgi:transposase